MDKVEHKLKIRRYEIDSIDNTILDYVKNHPRSRAYEFRDALSLTDSQVRYRLFMLTLNEYLECDTSRKKRYYYSLKPEVSDAGR